MLRPVLIALLIAAITGCASGRDIVVLENATLIDGTGAPPRPGTTIVIDGDTIVAVGGSPRIPRGATRHDLTGRFVIPGLIDMHAHIAAGPVETDADGSMRMVYDADASRALAAELLRWGVTTVRNPAGPTAEAVALRDALNAGTVPGPRVVTAGAVIDQSEFGGLGVTVRTVDEVRAEVRRQAAAGVDLIKLYASLTPDLMQAGIDEAHAHGLPAIGHLWLTDWPTAVELGIDGIVHALPMSHSLLPPDGVAPFVQALHRHIAEGTGGTQAMYLWFEHADLESDSMRAVYATMAARGVHHDPTLVAIESMFFGDHPRVLENPDLASVPAILMDNWRDGFSLTMGWTDDDHRRAQAVFPRVLALVKLMYEAGVPLTAGSDLVMPWLAPGASLHRELELLVAAGIPPLDVITIATRNAARALGAQHAFGTVEPGKRADLVVLDADPVADIRNTRRIALVFSGGVRPPLR